jgi:hypothetical protein
MECIRLQIDYRICGFSICSRAVRRAYGSYLQTNVVLFWVAVIKRFERDVPGWRAKTHAIQQTG